jgi:uncharacterized membrane-anchored protein
MASPATIQGALRADRRTKDLVQRLKPGDIALIRHPDLDATAARALVDSRVAAVVNAAQSITGRYPNRGPSVLLEARVPLLDAVGDEFFDAAMEREGAVAVLEGDCLRLPDGLCGHGAPLTVEGVDTLEYMQEEQSLLLDPIDLPDLRTDLRGKHAVIVVRGEGYKEDLLATSHYFEDVRPVLIGVDGGADALLEEGWKPDIIIGDMDSVSDKALRCGAELVVHGYARGDREAPGLKRIHDLGLEASVFHAPGTSEDVAMLLADEKGASVIVAVGTHFSLEEFLDKNRRGMASTFLVRLRTGAKLVDAKGLGRLYTVLARSRNRPATVEIILIFVATLFPIGAMFYYSPWLRTFVKTLWLDLWGR